MTHAVSRAVMLIMTFSQGQWEIARSHVQYCHASGQHMPWPACTQHSPCAVRLTSCMLHLIDSSLLSTGSGHCHGHHCHGQHSALAAVMLLFLKFINAIMLLSLWQVLIIINAIRAREREGEERVKERSNERENESLASMRYK